MPHMCADGASRSWLLREACHIHWSAIAARLGVNPTEFRDRSGARVLASVVACTVRGEAAQFREDDTCQMFLIETPSAENGWRSQVELRNTRNHRLRVEIITSFARRGSDQTLEEAELEPHFQPHQEGDAARRASVIRRLGHALYVAASQIMDPPDEVIEVDPVKHVNGVGLVYFAAIHDMMAASERKALSDLARVWPMRDRRIHFYNTLDIGDKIEITYDANVQALSSQAGVVVVTHAKRASDGAVIAAAESIYEV